jgi:hypothetical protein
MFIGFVALLPSFWAFPTILPPILEDLEHSLSSVHSRLSSSSHFSTADSLKSNLLSTFDGAEEYVSQATSITSDQFQIVASAFPNGFSLIDRALKKLKEIRLSDLQLIDHFRKWHFDNAFYEKLFVDMLWKTDVAILESWLEYTTEVSSHDFETIVRKWGDDPVVLLAAQNMQDPSTEAVIHLLSRLRYGARDPLEDKIWNRITGDLLKIYVGKRTRKSSTAREYNRLLDRFQFLNAGGFKWIMEQLDRLLRFDINRVPVATAMKRAIELRRNQFTITDFEFVAKLLKEHTQDRVTRDIQAYAREALSRAHQSAQRHPVYFTASTASSRDDFLDDSDHVGSFTLGLSGKPIRQ